MEDEEALADAVAYSLRREGLEVGLASDGEQAMERFRAERPALVILDLMLPKLSGLDADLIEKEGAAVSLLEFADRGGRRPGKRALFVPEQLALEQLMGDRRTVDGDKRTLGSVAVAMDGAGEPGQELRGHLRSHHEASVQGRVISLTPKEFELLELFLARKGRLLTRERLIEEVWGSDYFGDTRTLDVHVKRLRQKVEEDPHHPRHILTVRGLGYKFVD